MILRIEDLQGVCSKLLAAIDISDDSLVTEVLELEIIDTVLHLSLTNREYVVIVKIPAFTDETFHATVMADQFLRLISQFTTDTVEFTIEERTLKISGNGTYYLPLIFDGESLMSIPQIKILNETASFNIKLEHLKYIYTYNTKELSKKGIVNPVQNLYYVDNQGCITFTNGACVTNFDFGGDIVMLLSAKLLNCLNFSTTILFYLSWVKIVLRP